MRREHEPCAKPKSAAPVFSQRTQDAVAAVLYLLSDEARYVNGTNLHLSGAWGI